MNRRWLIGNFDAPIEVLAHFDLTGAPRPYRITLEGKELKIEQVVSVTEEKLSGNRMLCFRCQSEIKGELRPFEIIFEMGMQVVFMEDVVTNLLNKHIVLRSSYFIYTLHSHLQRWELFCNREYLWVMNRRILEIISKDHKIIKATTFSDDSLV